MASRIARKEWMRALPSAIGEGRYERKLVHSASERSVGYVFLIEESAQNHPNPHPYQTGSKNAGIVVADPVTYLKLGDFTRGPVLLAVFGLVLTLALVARGVRGGLVAGILLTGLVGMIFGVLPFPSSVVSLSFDTSTIGGGVLAVPEVLQLSLA